MPGVGRMVISMRLQSFIVSVPVPLELDLMLKRHSFTNNSLHEPHSQGLVDEMRWLSGYLDHYPHGTQPVLMQQQEYMRI
jgi:hypothetical protein